MTLKYYNDLAYEEIGEENNEIILFLHTKLLGKWIWKKQKEGHSQYFNDYHCIFLDLPNHGESKTEGEFSISKASIEVIQFIEALIEREGKNFSNPKKINIVALGIGSSIAIEIINKIPQMIDSLVVSGPEIADWKEDETNSIVNGLAKTQSEYLNEKSDIFITKAYLRYYGIPKEYYDDVEMILERSIKEEKKIAFESLNYTIPKDLLKNNELLEKDNILIIYGNKEDLDCTKSAIGLKNLFKKGKLVEINRGKHLWNIIDCELFNAIVIDFIKSNHIKENSKVKIIE